MEILQELGLNGTFLVQLVCFVVLVFLLKLVAYKPLVKIMSERKKYIAEQINASEASREAAEQIKTGLEAELKKAREEAHAIVEQATKNAESLKDEILASAKSEAAKELQKAREAIEVEREKAVATLRHEVATLAVLAAGKILGKAISTEEHQELVDQYIQGVGEIQ
ncbi:F0F1 ATP synthase subunit B [Candidatus Formimonas warabiya]|uniref:F0F1 ATP synthase subunit B n=1 Tax=Formimonas warabiya TaxID=1761012 RepID=UPI0011D0C3EC|nr:F0F1 ATP synthase subunit B [Candidatus Formimonas warabiya]